MVKSSAAAYALMYQVLGAALVQIIHITYTRVVLGEVDVVVLYVHAAAAIEIAQQNTVSQLDEINAHFHSRIR